MASEMAAIDLMSSTLYLQVCTVSLSPACDDELMSSCLGSLSNEELAGFIMCVILNFIRKYVIHVHCRSVRDSPWLLDEGWEGAWLLDEGWEGETVHGYWMK